MIAPKTVPIPAAVPFRLGRTPVTNRDYAPFLALGRVPEPPWWRDARFSAAALPVVGVSWEDAMAFCAWVAESAGGTWRLPTEAEWEHAACGGLKSPATAWGSAVPPGEIPEGPLDAPWEAGRGTPNGYGLYDMGTIVHEWCLNWREPLAPPPHEARRASRGGSWRHAIRWSPPSASSSLPPAFRYSDYGFRVLEEGA
ncbi:MAG: SUMF1/EgtB/PvdO family nonheme iron enzyme [Thermoanaerobaculia bacterium]